MKAVTLYSKKITTANEFLITLNKNCVSSTPFSSLTTIVDSDYQSNLFDLPAAADQNNVIYSNFIDPIDNKINSYITYNKNVSFN